MQLTSLQQKAKDVLHQVNLPASIEQIQELEQKLNVQLPTEYIELLSFSDGGTSFSKTIINHFPENKRDTFRYLWKIEEIIPFREATQASIIEFELPILDYDTMLGIGSGISSAPIMIGITDINFGQIFRVDLTEADIDFVYVNKIANSLTEFLEML